MPVREFQQPFDWTYNSDYWGTLGPGLSVNEQPTTERINYEKLNCTDSILFSQDIMLFEDELGDHGISRVIFLILIKFQKAISI